MILKFCMPVHLADSRILLKEADSFVSVIAVPEYFVSVIAVLEYFVGN